MFRCVIQHIQGEHRYYLLKTIVGIWKRHSRHFTYSYLANAAHFASCPIFTQKFMKRTKAPLARAILECFDVERMTERTDKTATTVC